MKFFDMYDIFLLMFSDRMDCVPLTFHASMKEKIFVDSWLGVAGLKALNHIDLDDERRLWY